MAVHRDLPDEQLHEPKGVAGASPNTVYRANGSGSGVWVPLSATNSSVSDPNNVFVGVNVETVLFELYQTIQALQARIEDLENA